MTDKKRYLLDLIGHYGFERFYPQLSYVHMDARDGRLSDAEIEHYIAFLEERRTEFDRVPWHLLEWPTEDELYANGAPEVRLGHVRDHPELVFGLSPSRGVQHLLVQGRTGAGKTGLLRRFLKAMRRWAEQHGVQLVFFVFDLKGGDFRVFAHELGPSCLHLSADETLRVSFGGPASVPLHVWNAYLGACLGDRLDLQFAVETVLHANDWLLPLLNPQPTPRWKYPSLKMLRRLLEIAAPTMFSTKVPYTESAIQACARLIRTSGPLFCTTRGLDLTELLAAGKSCVIQMPNVNERVACLVVDLLLGQLLLDRRTRHVKTSQVHAVICIDECDSLIEHTGAAKMFSRWPVLALLAKQGRELGVQLALGTSRLVGTNPQILANIHNLVLLRQIGNESVREAARALMQPGIERVLGALTSGECLFRLAEGWTHTTAGVIDFVPPHQNEDGPVYDTHPYEPETSLDEHPGVQAALAESSKQHRVTRLRATQAKQDKVSKQGRNLLDAWSLHPFTPIARLWESLGVTSFNTQRTAREELTQLELADFEDWRTGKPTRGLMVITSAGWKFLRKDPPRLRGRGGIKHRHAAHWIHGVHQEKGRESHIEWLVPGTNHAADVACKVDVRWNVYEVVVNSEDNLVQHIQACLLISTEVETVTVVAGTKKELHELKATIAAEPSLQAVQSRIRYEPVETFLRVLYP